MVVKVKLTLESHGSIMNRQGTTNYGDATYYSCGAKFVHNGKDYHWQTTFTGHSSVMAIARHGFVFWNTQKRNNPGVTPVFIDMAHLNTSGNLHLRGSVQKLSDVREKKNVKSLDRIESLDKILKLNPVMFDWKDDSRKKNNLGLIAQEVEEILPQIVDENEPSEMAGQKTAPKRKSVDYESIIPLLISSIQNQQQQINKLKKQLNLK